MPNAWNAGDYSSASMAGSVGWYRRDFVLPRHAFATWVAPSAQRWIVRFESVNYRATVWLNGHLLGSHAGAYLPFEFDLAHLHPGVNRLIVRVDDRRRPGDLPPGPGGGWWNFGGLLGEVYLRAVAGSDIAAVQIRTPLSGCGPASSPAALRPQAVPGRGCTAAIQAQASIRNLTARAESVSLTGRYGPLTLQFGTSRIAPGATWVAQTSAALAHPHLWSLSDPHLYRATLTLSDSQGRRLGGYVTYSGVRTIAVRGGQLRLNGQLLHLRGVNLHEQSQSEGAALDPAHLDQLFGWAKALGATIIRAHYPLDPEIEELADREGVLLWSEIPVYQVASTYLAEPSWRASAEAVLTSNILANQNHPSVLLWSIGNELPSPATGAEAGYIAAAAALAHRLDPTRPVGMAVSAWPGLDCQSAYAPLDVVGFNDYFGWYDAGGGSTDDQDALSPFLDSFRACYPNQAVFVSEFGFEANRTGPVEERGTYAFQAAAAAFHLGVFASKPWLSGAIYFALQDFAVTPGWTGGNPWPDPPFLHKGLVDLSGNEKPAFSAVSQIFHATRQVGG